MANIKEKDLPVASSVASTDYLRMVDSSGASKRVQVNTLRTPKLLWTNSGTSAFAGQTIPLDLTNYDCIRVHYYMSSTAGLRFERSTTFRKGQAAIVIDVRPLENSIATHIFQRRMSATNTGVTFSDGALREASATTVTTSNTVINPVAIYGV